MGEYPSTLAPYFDAYRYTPKPCKWEHAVGHANTSDDESYLCLHLLVALQYNVLLYLSLAALRVSPSLFVHLLGDAHKVCPDNIVLHSS